MLESEFDQRAETVFATIEQVIDAAEADVDYQRSGNVLELELENGQKIILNRHDVNQEVWLAARAGGFHFAWQDGRWWSNRDQCELYACLQAILAEYAIDMTFA